MAFPLGVVSDDGKEPNVLSVQPNTWLSEWALNLWCVNMHTSDYKTLPMSVPAWSLWRSRYDILPKVKYIFVGVVTPADVTLWKNSCVYYAVVVICFSNMAQPAWWNFADDSRRLFQAELSKLLDTIS